MIHLYTTLHSILGELGVECDVIRNDKITLNANSKKKTMMQ